MQITAVLKGGPACGRKLAWRGGNYIRVAEAPTPRPVGHRPPADVTSTLSITTHEYHFERFLRRDVGLFRWVAPA